MQHKRVIQAGAAAGIAILLVAGWWVYDLGKLHGVVDLGVMRTDFAIQGKRQKQLIKDNRALQEQVAILDRSSQIDRQAAQNVKANLGQLEEELQAAREELEFYRGIIAPGDVQSGLRIHRFNLEEGGALGVYHYELVLTQLKRNDRYITGTVDWRIIGSMLGEPGEFALAGVTRPAVKQLKFRFRYFQALAGTITLPDGFAADKVTLSVKTGGKGKALRVEQTFDWSASE